MSKNLKETATNILKQSNRNPAIYSIFIAIFGCAFFVYEFFNTFSFNLNTPIENWVATASYFNNVFSPILLFVSILLLYRTWKDSRSALELQKIELEETKLALREQSDTQNFSVIKDAVFEIANQVKELLQVDVKVINKNTSYALIDVDNPLHELPTNFLDIDWDDECSKETIQTIKLESIIETYFFHMKGKPFENEEKETQFENIIFTDTFFTYID
ncbi:hypothetical protein, partial [Pseudoalteromonas porphyrae]